MFGHPLGLALCFKYGESREPQPLDPVLTMVRGLPVMWIPPGRSGAVEHHVRELMLPPNHPASRSEAVVKGGVSRRAKRAHP
jgi:hypothetical protein